MTTLLVPGLDGSPAPHWQAWWADRDPGAVVVGQDDFAAPDPTAWELRLAMALLIAPADVERPRDPRVAGFGPIPRWRLPFPAIVAASRNDPWMTPARGRRFAGAWGASLIDLGEVGHVNAESDHGPWPEGLALAETLSAPRSRARDAI